LYNVLKFNDLKVQSYKNNCKPEIKTLKSYFHPYRGCPKSLKITFAPLHFAKVLIARRATTFAKVDYSDNQSLLECVM